MSRDQMFVTDATPEVIAALGDQFPTRQQWEAIAAPPDEPCVLIAGAGSGKTAVMTARMVWLIVKGHAEASQILGLTFTNRAAASLLERVRRAIAPLGLPDGEEPTIQTYHSFASSLIADYGLRAGIEPAASLLSEAQAWQLLADLYTSRTYEFQEVRNLWHVPWIRQLAEDCANHLVEPDEVVEWDRAFLERIDPNDKISGRVKICSRKRIEFAEVVASYRDAKRQRRTIDYGDQIRLAYEIAQDPKVTDDFRARYRFVLLDEYQDTNIAQAKMLRALMPAGFPVMAVGDPDQNIYAWRGASLRNLLAFPTDFPRADGTPARALPLEVNFRSGNRILQLANTLIEGIPEVRRPPDKVLRHFPPLGEGEVAIFSATDQVAEAERIADEAVAAHDAGTPWKEIAILVRKKRLFDTMVEVMRAREIPLEVIGLGGLLKVPEVIDLVALLRVLEDPMRNVALARLLMGPRWRIGYRDIALIARHASILNKELVDSLPGEIESPGDVEFSLAEAIERLDEIEGVGDEARARLSRFTAELAALRAQAHLPLPELAARALNLLGTVRELDASPSPAATAAKRNLANFLDRIASFQPLDGEATLGTLVEWLDAIDESDEDMEAAQPTEDDSVKLMTIHQAKGLEYDLVFLAGLAGSKKSKIFPDTSRQANPITSHRFLPFELRGDADVLPTFNGVLSHFNDELRDRAAEEERRLLYVAVTRARKRLVCSAAWWYEPAGMGEALANPMEPSDYWREIRGFPGVEVIDEVDLPEDNPLIERRAQRARTWPRPARREPPPAFPDGIAAAVAAARATTEPDDTLFPMEAAAPAPPARVLSVSSLVTYGRCPLQFYWSAVRPLPRRPSSAARIGTLVHAWIERQARGQITLIDLDADDEADGGGGGAGAGRAARSRAAFDASRFAGVKPLFTERPFALLVGDVIVQGRIDAIFARDGGWEIVDWKTGRAPEDPDRLQLDLYALAAQEIWGMRPEDLTLTFAYLGDAEPVELTFPARPAAEIRAELEATLAAIGARAFDPTPGPVCGSCDFRRDCGQGRAWLAANT